MAQPAFPLIRRIPLPPTSRSPLDQYRAEVQRLVEFDGVSCLWRVVLGAVAFVLLPALAISAFVGAVLLAGDDHSFARLVVAGAVTFGIGQVLTAFLWRRRPWTQLIAGKLNSYEQIDGPTDINAVIRRQDASLAYLALRRIKLVPVGGTIIPALADAPDLDLKLTIGRSSRWHPDAPELYVQIIDCLRKANIRARVGREDIVPT